MAPVRCERGCPDESSTPELNPAAFSSRELCKEGRKEGGREGGRKRRREGVEGGGGEEEREVEEERKEYINEGDVKMVWFVTQTCEGMLWPCWLPASSPTASRNERTA